MVITTDIEKAEVGLHNDIESRAYGPLGLKQVSGNARNDRKNAEDC